MFIQLVEPGMTPDLHEAEKEIAIGIDLGTTHSVVAYATNQTPTVLAFDTGKKLLPSIVSYGDEVVVGEKRAFAIQSIKRLIGRQTVPEDLMSHYPDAVVSHKALKLKIKDRELTPSEISAEILKVIRQNAENVLGQTVHKAVITVPAYFDEAARQETKQAAKLAGLEVLRLINEPTAAALAYGLDKQVEGVYAVYDFGGGTFDVSLLKFTRGVFQVLATGGDTLLGGDDVDYLVQHYLQETYPTVADSITPTIARELKEMLANHQMTSLAIKGHTITLTQQKLTELCQLLVAKTLQICGQVLRDAGLDPRNIDGVILVGGSTRLQVVRQEVASFFGKIPLTDINPDEVVALGAALQAEALTRGSDTLLLDITPLSLGLETMGGIVEKIIERNTPIPVAIAQEFTTYQDGQAAMQIHVLQGERELVKDCRSLGQFTLTGIPPMAAGAAKVRVTFQLDADGLLTVMAKEMATGQSQQIEINPAYGLSDAEMIQHLRDNFEHGAADMEQRLLIEARVDARQMLVQLKGAIVQDGDLLTIEEQEALQQAIESLEKIVVFEDRNAIKQGMQELETLSFSFAERRINRSIQRALAGQKIGEL
ncbi:Fe-S protein assembly chaperone HscA [Candidatus Paracaedibacter symbiosus]|uniref:Fe-S protein assembly chaperone HscA n=1 Tax=Candidatus Paracaedibacter symbiosus TaxID=244582 RepID=UPI000509A135|nr:Fe-S protein assembly chaperone HscA [Candidatus Paracaedibacter symbiosus]